MSVAQYYPLNGTKGRLRLGLTSISNAEWIQYEDDFSERIVEKKNLISDQRNRVIQSVEGSEDAQHELLESLLTYISVFKSDLFTVKDDSVISHADNNKYVYSDYENNPLELLSYLAPDDFCLLEEFNDDYRFVAGSVCAPTWWDLAEKIGRPMREVHAPIEKLEEKIGRMIRHFFSNLKVDDYFQRANWFLFTNSNLCVFKSNYNENKDINGLNIDNIEDNLYLRCERQSFRKLKNTKNIVFGIKIYVSPISIVKKHFKIAEDLEIAMDSMSKVEKQVTGISVYEKLLKQYLHKAM